jgi:hypothetical protein
VHVNVLKTMENTQVCFMISNALLITMYKYECRANIFVHLEFLFENKNYAQKSEFLYSANPLLKIFTLLRCNFRFLRSFQ